MAAVPLPSSSSLSSKSHALAEDPANESLTSMTTAWSHPRIWPARPCFWDRYLLAATLAGLGEDQGLAGARWVGSCRPSCFQH